MQVWPTHAVAVFGAPEARAAACAGSIQSLGKAHPGAESGLAPPTGLRIRLRHDGENFVEISLSSLGMAAARAVQGEL